MFSSLGNPIQGVEHQCWVRPKSKVTRTPATGSMLYTSVGIYNTNGKAVTSLKIAGITGKANGGSSVYYDLTFPYSTDAMIEFTMDDGTTGKVAFSDCQGYDDNVASSNVEIWS